MYGIDLSGKVAIITGSTGGIGSAISRKFKECGAIIIGTGLHGKKGIYDELYTFDISNTTDCEQMVKNVFLKYGRIDILVNCAGITKDSMTKKMTEQQFDDVINVNLKGTWNMGKFVGPIMQSQNGGTIINISSVVGIYGNIGQANYAATKAGVIGLSLVWAKEFALRGGNVRVNVVAPGYTLTDMVRTVPQNLLEKFAGETMLGRLAEPDEIANTVLFLASDMSSYVTGEVLNVNGGMRL